MNVIKNKKNIYGVDWDFYIKNGYYLIKEIFDKNFLKIIKSHFIEIYEQENGKCSQHQLLKNDVFLNLIEYPNIPTLGIDFNIKLIPLKNNKIAKIQTLYTLNVVNVMLSR